MSDVPQQVYQRLATLEALVQHLYEHLQVPPPPFLMMGQFAGIPPEIVDLVRAGKKIDAIKLHRQMFGSSLSEAKDVIDSL